VTDWRRVGKSIAPAGLEWLRGPEAGGGWLDTLPELLEECVER
jgi:hypothetical protein